jgi:hypothetical protein
VSQKCQKDSNQGRAVEIYTALARVRRFRYSWQRRVGAHVVYVLEFFVFEREGDKRVIDRMTRHANTIDEARNHARTVLKNVLFRGRRADFCEVKDPMGNILVVVPPPA